MQQYICNTYTELTYATHVLAIVKYNITSHADSRKVHFSERASTKVMCQCSLKLIKQSVYASCVVHMEFTDFLGIETKFSGKINARKYEAEYINI
jgi:hypothetical protein